MFQRLPEDARAPLSFLLDGEPVQGRAGDSVAAALLALGRDACRETAVSGALRGGYCMMGVCFDCLVTIDGVGNRQACLVPLRDGMEVETQHGRREPGR
ncbi:MAG TPA: (2Fe-2S)-binding protein [Roseomonas sp.]|nr:(2Fe-2S)-binding protein [Roseomonas sp.]